MSNVSSKTSGSFGKTDLPPQSAEEADAAGALRSTSMVGMVVFLCAWAMMFASLFFAYAFVRSRSGTWPPMGAERVGLTWPIVNTLCLLASSVLLERARVASARSARAPLLLSALLGGAFLAGQVWLWATSGLTAQSAGMYGAVLLALCGFHAVHVAVGVVALAVLAARGGQGGQRVRLWSWYWHFVGVVWGVMFVALFVL
jgi:cytochrome c oxidase subunit III